MGTRCGSSAGIIWPLWSGRIKRSARGSVGISCPSRRGSRIMHIGSGSNVRIVRSLCCVWVVISACSRCRSSRIVTTSRGIRAVCARARSRIIGSMLLQNGLRFLLATISLHRDERVACLKLALIVARFLFWYSHPGESANDPTCRRSYGCSTQRPHQYAARDSRSYTRNQESCYRAQYATERTTPDNSAGNTRTFPGYRLVDGFICIFSSSHKPDLLICKPCAMKCLYCSLCLLASRKDADNSREFSRCHAFTPFK